MNTQAFNRIFIIMLENQTEEAVMSNEYMASLASQNLLLNNYFGVIHPSQPNYIASTAGLPFITDDNPHDIDATNIVDLLEAANISWKSYQENLPVDDKTCTTSPDGLYWRKHNPFVSFLNIQQNENRMANIVNADQLSIDLAQNNLPQYSWFTPNIQNDGHTPPNGINGVDYIAQWLQSFLPNLMSKIPSGTLVVITFDESIPYDDNHIYTLLLGDMITSNTTVSEHYDHYSLLRTVEENFQLGTLNRNDLTADFFRFLWGLPPQTFDWANHRQ